MELKPCPFCGGKAKVGYAISDYNRWGVECQTCGASVEVGYGNYPDTEEAAIKKWNGRK